MRILAIVVIFLIHPWCYSQFVPVSVMEINKPEGLTYAANYYFNKWYTISTITPSMSNYDDKTTLTFSISPSLPTGLYFDTSNGQISGTPTDYDISGTTYTITASNQAGSSQTTTDIFVVPADHTWSGNAFPDTNWSTGANWVGMNPPTNIDSALFDNYCSSSGGGCNATIDVSIDIDDLQMKPDYTGTITQSGAVTLNFGSNSRSSPYGIVMEGGTFVGGSGDITMDVLQLTAGTFTATSGNLRIGYNAQWGSTEESWVRIGVTFNHNNGTVIFDPTGNNSAFRKNHEIELDQTWALYNLEFDIDSGTTLADGEVSGNYMRIRGTVGAISVANELHFRDGWGQYGTIQFYGNDVYFHCDAPTYDKCSDTTRDLDGPGPGGITELQFLGASAQTYSYDAGADSWASFTINNSNGVTTSSTGDFSIPGIVVDNGNFSAPASSDLYLFRQTGHAWRDVDRGIDLNGTGTFTHNNSTIIANSHTYYSDSRNCLRFTDDITLYNLTVDCAAGSTYGNTDVGVDLDSGVDLIIENDLRVIDGKFDGGGTQSTITVRGDYYRECSQQTPGHNCADQDDGNIAYIFDTSGSTINIAQGADQNVSGNLVFYRIDPGPGGTVTLNGGLTTFGSNSDLNVVSGTFHLNSGSGMLVGDQLINNGAITCAAGAFIQVENGSISGTPGAGNDPTCYSTSPSDPTLPGTLDWANFTGSSSEETITDINFAVRLQISVTHTLGAPVIEWRGSNDSWNTIGNGASATPTFIAGETLQFRTNGGTSGDTATITITNQSDGGAAVDTIIATVP